MVVVEDEVVVDVVTTPEAFSRSRFTRANPAADMLPETLILPPGKNEQIFFPRQTFTPVDSPRRKKDLPEGQGNVRR